MPATRNYFQNGQMLFLAKVINFSNRENTYNYMVRPKSFKNGHWQFSKFVISVILKVLF